MEDHAYVIPLAHHYFVPFACLFTVSYCGAGGYYFVSFLSCRLLLQVLVLYVVYRLLLCGR